MIRTVSVPAVAHHKAPRTKSQVELIADRLEDLNRLDQGVSKDDLLPYFPKATIDRYGQEAVDLALARSVRAA